MVCTAIMLCSPMISSITKALGLAAEQTIQIINLISLKQLPQNGGTVHKHLVSHWCRWKYKIIHKKIISFQCMAGYGIIKFLASNSK